MTDKEILLNEVEHTPFYDKRDKKAVIEMIKSIPALNRKETHNEAHWILFKNTEHGPEHMKCSNCGGYWAVGEHAKLFKYCPFCGYPTKGELK